MAGMDMKNKIKDLLFSVSGIVLMNVVLQFLLYPSIERKLGAEAYGVALTLIAVISITSNSVGSAANYSRLVSEKTLHPKNGEYTLFLLTGGLVSVAVGLIVLWKVGLFTAANAIFYALLTFVSAFRYYSDAEFKLKGNTLRYFAFYFFISLGYVLGLAVAKWTGNWMTGILTGEVFAVLYAMIRSGIYKKPFVCSPKAKEVWKSNALLLCSNLFDNLTLNADRIVLLAFLGGEAVSTYYVASLFGKVVALLTVPVNALLIGYLVRSDAALTKKLWTIFTAVATGIGLLAFGGCLLGSWIILPILYKNLSAAALKIAVPAVGSQILFFVSGVLLIVVLRYAGEKKQFLLNLVYGVAFFLLTVLGTWKGGLSGFLWASVGANALRYLLVVIWGFFAGRPAKSGTKAVDGAVIPDGAQAETLGREPAQTPGGEPAEN